MSTTNANGLKRTPGHHHPNSARGELSQSTPPCAAAGIARGTRVARAGARGAMGGGPRPGDAQRVLLVALVALCSLLVRPQPSAAFFFFGVRSGGARSSGGGGREEKVPMTVVVADYSPRPAPFGPSFSPTAAPAPAPVPGSDEDGTPRLPSERRQSPGDHHGAAAAAGAPAGATSTDFISSSPAVPLPAGVTDSATVLPMPTPGQQQQLRDSVGMGALQVQVGAVQLAVPILMMLSFRALWCW